LFVSDGELRRTPGESPGHWLPALGYAGRINGSVDDTKKKQARKRGKENSDYSVLQFVRNFWL
jgi:hypothetical protein